MRDRDPSVRFATNAYVLPAGGETTIPVTTINTDEIEARLQRIGDRALSRAIADGRLLQQLSEWQITEVPDAGPVIAAWTFHPFGTKLPDASFGLAVESGLGLAAGEAVQIFEVEKDNAFIHKVADAVVNADGTSLEITPTAEGLHELTWLLFTQ